MTHKKQLVAIGLFAVIAFPWWDLCQVAHAQTRGLRITAVTKQGGVVPLYSGYRAVVIGAGAYEHCPLLPHAVEDAREVAQALKRLGFDVTLVSDPDAEEMRGLFKKLWLEIGDDPNLGLLIYFAGHGDTVTLADGSELGYLLPVDCPLQAEDRATFDERAVSMRDIEEVALKVRAKHLLMLFDSCFSGSIFSLTRAMPRDISEKTARSVRQFITAGGENEEVPDKSIFKQVFLEALVGEGDLNGDGYMTGTELGMHLANNVVNYSKGTQHPQYGKIRNPKLDKGDFVFIIKEDSPPTQSQSQEAGLVSWAWSNPARLSFATTETTVAQYRACVNAGACEAKHHLTKSDNEGCNWGFSERDEHPMNCVNWHGAEQFCEWTGGRLPEEDEWGAEASEDGSRMYPWGDESPSCTRCVFDDGKTKGPFRPTTHGCERYRTWRVCSKTAGNSVSDLCDMSGNVWEWTSSLWDSEQDFRVVRGGSWRTDRYERLRPSSRGRYAPTYGDPMGGFRCVKH